MLDSVIGNWGQILVIFIPLTFMQHGDKKVKKIWFCIVVVICLACPGAWASEQTFNSVLHHQFSFYGGAHFYQAEGEFSSTKDGRPKITIDLDDLGLDENLVSPVFGAHFNFGKKWALRLDYFGYHDDAKNTAEFDFNFDDELVTAGAKLDSSLDLDIYVVNLAYNFYSTERAKFGMGFGVHLADIDLKISSQVSGDGIDPIEQEDAIDFTAPLPNLYVAGAYAFTDRFIMRYGVGWMSLNYDDYNGQLFFVNAVLEYWPFQHAGLGIGYRYLKVDIDYDPGKKKEKYDVKLPGPMIYATFGF
jgi:hypothetical protein